MAKGPLQYKELEDMLKTFRCQDLANLLSFANHPKNGKKNELYDRCLKLLEKGGVNIQLKIREIYSYKNLLQLNGTNNLSSINNSNNFITQSDMVLTNNNRDLFNSGVNGGGIGSGVNNINSQSIRQTNNYFSNNNHQQVFSSSTNMHGNNNIYQNNNNNSLSSMNSEIKFKKLAFYEFLHEVTRPMILQPISSNSRPFQFSFQFQLQCQQADEISTSRNLVDGKYEYTTQIQLRFALIENVSEQADNFPPNINVNVNGKPAQLPPPKPTSKPNADMIRPGRSVDITNLCRIAPSQSNKVDVTWTNTDVSKVYCVSVFVVKKLSTQTLMDRLIKNCRKPIEFSKQLVKEKLAIGDNDLEIETSTLKASLLCPLIKCRIKTPGRSILCKHVQCFDLTSYLSMNEKKPTWNCPVCDRHAPYEELIIDDYFDDILHKCTDCEEIQFFPNGDWAKIEVKKKGDKQNKPNNTTSVNIETTKITEPVISKPIIAPAKLPSSQSNNNIAAVPPKIICVDLTLDSDDENDFNIKKSNSNTSNNNDANNIRSKNDEVPTSPAASIISISSNDSPCNNNNNKVRSRNSSRSTTPHNLIINDIIDQQLDNIITSPATSNGILHANNASMLSPASLIPTTPTYSPKSPLTTKPTTTTSPLTSAIQPVIQNLAGLFHQNTSDFTTNVLFSTALAANNRKNSTSSTGSTSNPPSLISNNTIANSLFDEGRNSPVSPLSPSYGLVKNINMKAKNVTKTSNNFTKDKINMVMDELSNNQNTNYQVKDVNNLKLTKDIQKIAAAAVVNMQQFDNNNTTQYPPTLINNSNNNINRHNTNISSTININNQFNQQVPYSNNNNNKSYQIASAENLKMKLTTNNTNNSTTTTNNNSNFSSNDHFHNNNSQFNNLSMNLNKQQHYNQLSQQNRSTLFNNGNNNNSNMQRQNNMNYSNKNQNIYQPSRSNNNNPYEYRNPYPQQQQQQQQQQNMHHHHHHQQPHNHLQPQNFSIPSIQHNNSQMAARNNSSNISNNNLYQNNSSNNNRLQLAQSPPSHSHS